VIACNFLGDGLQDALDPRAQHRVVPETAAATALEKAP
jgi:hypothetical protein